MRDISLYDYGFIEKNDKHKRLYHMTMADMKLGVMKALVKAGKTNIKIRLMNVFLGELIEYKDMNDFILSDLNNGYDIYFVDAHFIHLIQEDEDVCVISITEVEDNVKAVDTPLSSKEECFKEGEIA